MGSTAVINPLHLHREAQRHREGLLALPAVPAAACDGSFAPGRPAAAARCDRAYGAVRCHHVNTGDTVRGPMDLGRLCRWLHNDNVLAPVLLWQAVSCRVRHQCSLEHSDQAKYGWEARSVVSPFLVESLRCEDGDCLKSKFGGGLGGLSGLIFLDFYR